MRIAKEDREQFLNLVCPRSRSIAEDLIDGKIDALYIGYGYFGHIKYNYTATENYGVRGQACIEIFENPSDVPSKLIMLNVTINNIHDDDLHIIHLITCRYGNLWEYGLLAKSDTDEELRWALLKVYANDFECSVILKKKFKKIYDSLSDSDKLLLEVSDDDDEWYQYTRI